MEAYELRKQAESDHFWDNRNDELYNTSAVYRGAWDELQKQADEEKLNQEE